MSITIYSMYNNKGGVGKTTLGFNIASQYAYANPRTQVLVIDMCPQANISQYLLGGAHNGYRNNQTLQAQQTRGNVVGFFDWLLRGNSNFSNIRRAFKVQVKQYNNCISENLYLIAGDSFLESLTLALSYAVINPANRNAWPEFMTAIRRLCTLEFNNQLYDNLVVFIDCNPSFSIYTQMALVSSDRLVIPMMADYSSLEGLKGITTLLYGIYPTAASQTYAQILSHFIVRSHSTNLVSLECIVLFSTTSQQMLVLLQLITQFRMTYHNLVISYISNTMDFLALHKHRSAMLVNGEIITFPKSKTFTHPERYPPA